MSEKLIERRLGFGDRLRSLRRQRKLTQARLDYELDVMPGTISRWERELVTPRPQQIIALANYFDVPLDELCGGDAQSNTAPPGAIIEHFELYRFAATDAGRSGEGAKLTPMLRRLAGKYTAKQYTQIVAGLLAVIKEGRQRERKAKT